MCVDSCTSEQQNHLLGHYRSFLQAPRTASQSVLFFILQMFAPLLYVQGACRAIYPALESSGQSLRYLQGCDPTLDNGETRTAAQEAQEELLASTGLVA